MSDTQEQGSVFVDSQSYRLPDTVIPERYQIRLTPDLKAFTFAGEETVTITVRESVNEIVFNAAELQIHTVSVTAASGNIIQRTATLDEANERARCSFPQTLSPGSWHLRLTFSGI